MALKRLPNDVQSLLCASSQVNSYKKAVEELVFNSLDSESTSIAIRINIDEGAIQVIDNGYGINKHDLNALGQRYMTSKVTDMSTLKAAPKKYGYRGEFLANIIKVSQIVKITSRHESTDETWAKTFLNGKEKKFTKMSTRPANGTTVDIKGFLYNLNIQKRGINPINELQNIKSFLEQLSLQHNNISLSLRDDSKNEIIFKIHKKRDIYQTLSTLFDIDKAGIQELQVEKNEYKVKGLIGKTDKELDLHWIYLNGKFIHGSSKLHKIVNENFKKFLHLKDYRMKKSKMNNEEHQLFNQRIPFYFIFITCPYIDYDMSFTSLHSVIELKNWEQMNKLLEKLIKFYVGDVDLKEIKKPEKNYNKQINIECHQDTRDQVKKIMTKILGSNSKKIGVSQLQNGVKGKLAKRKTKKKTIKKSANISTLFRQNDSIKAIDDKSLSKHKRVLNIEQNTEVPVNQINNNVNENKIANKSKNSKHIEQNPKAPNPEKYKKEKMKIISTHRLKAKNLSPIRKTHQTSAKPKHILNKHKKRNVHKNECKLLKGLKETDSVYKRSKIVAQKAEEFLNHDIRKRQSNINKIKNNIQQEEDKGKKGKKNIITGRPYIHNAFNNNESRTLQRNKYIIDKYVMNKLKTRSFKTTYDLVQTILSQQEEKYNFTINMSKGYYYESSDFHYSRNKKPLCVQCPKRSTRLKEYMISEYSDIYGNQRRTSQHTTRVPIQFEAYTHEENETSTGNQEREITNYIPSITEESLFMWNSNYTRAQNTHRQETSYFTLNGPQGSKLTYESHQYNQNEHFETNVHANMCSVNRRQKIRFITKQSKDNFITVNDFRNKIKKPSKSKLTNKLIKLNDIRMKQSVDETFSIEYSKTNKNNDYNQTYNGSHFNSPYLLKDKFNLRNETKVNFEEENEKFPIIGNTYTVQPPNDSINIESQNQIIKSDELFNTYSIHYSNSNLNDITYKTINNKDKFPHERNNLNFVFVSNSQCCETGTPLDNNIDPLNVCETILNESSTVEKEFAFSFNRTNDQLNDSLYDNIGDTNERFENEPFQITKHDDNIDCPENISHHFSNTVNTKKSNVILENLEANSQENVIYEIHEIIRPKNLPNSVTCNNDTDDNINCIIDSNDFNLKTRLRFVPKGMSQIFDNPRARTASDSNLDEDYYEDSIYNNFVNDVQVNTEIYEPIIHNAEDVTTKNIHKFRNKLKKDNASLVFDEKSLKGAKVLGQADSKFIAAIMKKQDDVSETATEYLILFDQHAVHERIRLETNLADYIKEDRWTSVPLNNVILKMSNDEIVYLHNYKDKFTQLGLQWTIANDNEITVNSIPEAILGKNPREVEKVIKAVRNLIVEEINVIKLQKGCVSLYPKSIMDLVFSEACRYAIKFGDQLSKNDCVELLTALSNCKTPFQCAHGRPVMAVLMDLKCDKHEYKVNMTKLCRFKRRHTNP